MRPDRPLFASARNIHPSEPDSNPFEHGLHLDEILANIITSNVFAADFGDIRMG